MLIPIFDDVLGDRARASVKVLEEDWEVQMQGATTIVDDHGDRKPWSMLPTRMMFLKDVP